MQTTRTKPFEHSKTSHSPPFRGARRLRLCGVKTTNEADPFWRGWIVTFDVSTICKGAVGGHFTLHVTAISEDDAFTSFRKAEEYMVFADVNLCQRLRPLRARD